MKKREGEKEAGMAYIVWNNGILLEMALSFIAYAWCNKYFIGILITDLNLVFRSLVLFLILVMKNYYWVLI